MSDVYAYSPRVEHPQAYSRCSTAIFKEHFCLGPWGRCGRRLLDKTVLSWSSSRPVHAQVAPDLSSQCSNALLHAGGSDHVPFMTYLKM